MPRYTRFALGKSAILSGPKVGVLLEEENQIVDLDAALGLSAPGDMKAFLEGGDASRAAAAAAVAAGTHRHGLGQVRLLAPIANPGKILCVGMNYEDHCLEQGMPLPDEPVIFCKFANAVLDPGAPIPLIPECKNLECVAARAARAAVTLTGVLLTASPASAPSRLRPVALACFRAARPALKWSSRS
jgi:hypothetical protein